LTFVLAAAGEAVDAADCFLLLTDNESRDCAVRCREDAISFCPRFLLSRFRSDVVPPVSDLILPPHNLGM